MEGIVAGAILILTLIGPSPKNQAVVAKPSVPLNPPQATQTVNTPTPKPFKKYSVQSGDTLDSIAKQHYGSGKYWTNLWNDNPWIEDPRLIKKGWELKISAIKPDNTEELSDKLADIYNKLTIPTPTPSTTPEPLKAVIGASTVQGPTGSFDDIYKQAGSKYGVPWEILYGIHLTETGLRDGAITSGYGTGAQGPMQFLQQTFNSYAIDGNGDGVPDINNAVDAIFTAANYIAAHGGVEQGLRAYGGDIASIINAARSRGWNQ